ncbi:MAG: 4-hydroxy-3-methylbut-2-enyl diphosphate reductase [Candidatus Moranbacteria bacterium RIFOXYB1_FULL_44_23]|nr:MAG: 4-hydroxy-3-methylbut-2-enyl diphosphate reductase [Candidatus Moranbacteria bacterium RIFOXYA1_FULL_44_8]OGI36900.1 MAG: 4-hydroxy-3-methylbut-2-enyl diphosphate reductase [Candidatus Moranbacteria bacterium RIFOXYC1_FULL_44_8]OGI39425.1 MAG: 4-hydroxy-3-methylbut-2-enyl diphosphate reductase [Candidatus Moranbacteria bacterium RIFOXYB1_FULL_44_23]OGI41872.1 MAG: 4-hydroxy-3-methylbut-2-enyl diphosphate reductase [Candidatus Moranbacteria bacterium RIFOXYD1_FULL_44_9]
MRITVGRHSGFCFGVKRAYDLASMNSFDCEKLYMLGKLVHNDDVCSELKKKGIKEIKRLSDIKDGAIIFTAHGVGPDLYEKANRNGLRIIDTTCPKVMKAQRLAQNFAEKGFQVIIFGDKKHKEVKGIKKWSRDKAVIVKNIEEAKKIMLNKLKKYCLIAQTTQNVAEFKKVKDYLARELNKIIRESGANAKRMRVNNFACFNTICDSTDNRQKEIRKLAKTCDAVTVIGGRDSANTRRLFEIAKSLNPRSYLIENANQLKKSWFNDIGKLAITAGASTPDWVIEEVQKYISKK